jgi:hypothetical protein
MLSAAAHANQIWIWNGSISGYTVSGTVSFSVLSDGTGYDLQLDITNTATTVPPTTADILTGVYFDLTASGQGALGVKSATATGGLVDATNQTTPLASTLNTNICAPGKGGTALNNTCTSTISGGWEAAYNPGGLGGGAAASQQYGVGTSGQGGVFSGNSANAGNANYGVVGTAGINTSLDGVGGMVPYSYHTVTIILSGLITPNVTITNVSGVYGTAPEGAPAAVFDDSAPEPGTYLLIAGGLGAIAFLRRRR